MQQTLKNKKNKKQELKQASSRPGRQAHSQPTAEWITETKNNQTEKTEFNDLKSARWPAEQSTTCTVQPR